MKNQAITKVQAIIIAVIIIIAIIAGAVYYYFMLSPKGPEAIKVGWPVPLTGGEAAFAESFPWVAKQIEDYINTKEGGIYVAEYGRKIPIKIIIRDTKSDPSFAATLAEELITREQIHVLMTSVASVAVPVSSIAERHKFPCLVSVTVPTAWLMGAPYEWSFAVTHLDVEAVKYYVDLWDLLKGKHNGIVAITGTDDPAGRTTREVLLYEAQARGYTVIDSGVVPAGTKDFAAYIERWKNENVQLLAGNIIAPDFIALWKQSYELGFRPKIACMGRAVMFPSTIEALGDIGLGLFTENHWHPACPYRSSITGQTAKEVAEAWEKESGKLWTMPIGYVYAGFEVLVDAIKRAGSLGKEKIREALAQTDLNTIRGRVNFKPTLSSEELKICERFPSLVQYKSRYAICPVWVAQWVRSPDGSLKLEIVYNGRWREIPITAEPLLKE